MLRLGRLGLVINPPDRVAKPIVDGKSRGFGKKQDEIAFFEEFFASGLSQHVVGRSDRQLRTWTLICASNGAHGEAPKRQRQRF